MLVLCVFHIQKKQATSSSEKKDMINLAFYRERLPGYLLCRVNPHLVPQARNYGGCPKGPDSCPFSQKGKSAFYLWKLRKTPV